MPSNRVLRYHALATYLARHDGRDIVLTFAEIQAIVGAELPMAATYTMTWWTTPTLMHVRLWREYGWYAQLDRASRQVRFIRDAEDAPDGE